MILIFQEKFVITDIFYMHKGLKGLKKEFVITEFVITEFAITEVNCML